ncbi:hypothetical protein C8R46DRAFT_1345219 [Mycena filopes]|nr:hypothetical protein C8R46DRAFT_1345219 [Mycena filopes]
MPDDVFLTTPRKPPAHRRSVASLRAPPDDGADTAGGGGNGRFSLAHELAVAMMPEPSAGSKLLAEEFGIEFDEGAEGIDEPPPSHAHANGQAQIHVGGEHEEEDGGDLRADEGPPPAPDFGAGAGDDPAFGGGGDPTFGGPRAGVSPKKPEVDAMEVLAQDLESTDKFLGHLRRLDSVDPSSSASSSILPASSSFSATASGSSGGGNQPELERLASDVIRRINDTARDRETQVRELLECEREFRRIAGEVGGVDVLGQLEALPEDEPAPPPSTLDPESPTQLGLGGASGFGGLGAISEDVERTPTKPGRRPPHVRAFSQDWETDPDAEGARLGDAYGGERLGDYGDGDEAETDPAFDGSQFSPPASPTASRSAFSPSIPSAVPAFAASASTVPSGSNTGATGANTELAALRLLTTSLVASLTAISEHAQVNGAATAEAGRKIRALRNRLGGWRAEWEGAERSRGRIERWERGEGEGAASGVGTPTTMTGGGEGSVPGTPMRSATSMGVKRVDGRTVVAEHLRAFEVALAEAAVKTQAIMAVA